MAKTTTITTTIRISENLKSKLDAVGSKKDHYGDIIRRLLALHEIVKERDNALIEEARKRAEAESKE